MHTVEILPPRPKKYKTFFAMKTELKALAAAIRKGRADGYQHMRESYYYRHLHITYGLLRGRTLEQMENSITLRNKRDERLLEKLNMVWSTKIELEKAEETLLGVAWRFVKNA